MTLVQKFTEKYGVNPIKLVEDANLKNFGKAKSMGLEKLLSEYVDTEDIILVNNNFLKELVECFAEAGERFPENLKAKVDNSTKFIIPNQKVGIPKSKGVLENFKDIVGTDELRPSLTGVYVSEDGFIVGTDAHKLVKQKNNGLLSQSEYEGKIIDLPTYIKSKGKITKFIDATFPKYEAVIPKEYPYEDRALSTYSFYNYAKSLLDVKRLVESGFFNVNLNLMTDTSGGTTVFSIAYHIFYDAFNFAMLNGWDTFTIRYSEPNRAIVFDFGGDNIVLVMPVITSQEVVGTVALSPEEIAEKYRLGLTNQKASKPKASKKATVIGAPVSSEPLKPFKGDYDDDDTTYVLRKDIESITLTNGEVLGKNDVVHGFYRVKNKMAHGGSMYASGGKIDYYELQDLKNQESILVRNRLAFIDSDSEWAWYEIIKIDTELEDVRKKIEEIERKMAHGGSMYADVGSTPNGKDFLLSKGYDFDGEVYFESDGEVIEVVQGSKGTSKQIGIYFHTNEPISISRSMLDKISSSFGKSFEIKLFTNAGVDLRSSENSKFKNISVERIKYAHGGSMYADGGLIAYADGDMDSEIGRFSSLTEAKKFAKANKWRYNTISFQDEKYDEILVSKDDSFKDIDWLFSGKMAHGGSMYAGGGNTGRVKVGVFNEEQLRSGEDKKAIQKAQEETGLTYIDNKIIKKDGKMFMEVYLIPTEEYLKSNKFEEGGSLPNSYEVGDTVTFNSVMGGTKSGKIVSKLGEEGLRIMTNDGFATIKKSAII
jgi:hypothetical protein